jgi:uncharacterized protein YndB with AHSA1/START domain
MELKFEVQAKIKRPISDVFDAVYNPNKLSGYFTTGGASNPLDEGKEVTWDFHDFPGAFPVQVKQTIKNKKIVLEWANSEGGSTQVVMNSNLLIKIRPSSELKSMAGRIKFKNPLMNPTVIVRAGCKCFAVLKFT